VKIPPGPLTFRKCAPGAGWPPPVGRLCPDGTGPAAPDCMQQITPSPVFPLQAALKAQGR